MMYWGDEQGTCAPCNHTQCPAQAQVSAVVQKCTALDQQPLDTQQPAAERKAVYRKSSTLLRPETAACHPACECSYPDVRMGVHGTPALRLPAKSGHRKFTGTRREPAQEKTPPIAWATKLTKAICNHSGQGRTTWAHVVVSTASYKRCCTAATVHREQATAKQRPRTSAIQGGQHYSNKLSIVSSMVGAPWTPGQDTEQA